MGGSRFPHLLPLTLVALWTEESRVFLLRPFAWSSLYVGLPSQPASRVFRRAVLIADLPKLRYI
jgi:hypothetical protein